MKVKVFAFRNYKSFLNELVRQKDSRGLLTKLAQAAGCELSYLSRSLSHEINITSDHAFKISQFLNLSVLEQSYFMTLVELERAGDRSYKKFLQSRLQGWLNEYEDLSQKTEKKVVVESSSLQMQYHSSWIYCAIHLLVSIKDFQSANKIAERLQLPVVHVKQVLAQLIDMGFVSQKGADHFEYLSGAMHISKSSPLVAFQHQNFRQRAVLDSQNSNSDGLHYTSTYSIELKDYIKIKDLLFDSISRLEKIAGPSECEELVNINIDAFKL
jgi:uncharacterized protein (TIGR02147 family)